MPAPPANERRKAPRALAPAPSSLAPARADTPRSSLARRFLAAAAAVLLIALAGAHAVNLAIHHAQTSAERLAGAKESVNFAVEIVGLRMATQDVDGLESQLEALVAHTEIRRAFVLDRQNHILADGDTKELHRFGATTDALAARAWAKDGPIHVMEDGVLYAALPIRQHGESIAVLRLDVQVAKHPGFTQATLLAPIGVGLVLGILGLWLAFIHMRRLTRPLRDLAQLAQDADVTALTVRADIRTGDEIEVVASAFNRLMRRIETSMRRLHQIAFVDPVTQLSNRDRLIAELSEGLKGGNIHATHGAVIVINIERFGRVNETLGRARGDDLLKALAGRLDSSVRVADRTLRVESAVLNPSLMARTGADEFTIHIPDITHHGLADRFAQMVSAALRQPVEVAGHKLFLKCNCGIAIYPTDGRDTETLLRNAQLALAAAKTEGGTRIKFFTQAMDQRAQARLQLESELREAIEGNQLIAHFQPKVDLTSDRIVSCEALVRWRHPRDGVVSPGRFIEAAEQIGLMSQVGEAVLRDAAAQAALWVRAGHRVRVAVNVSMSQFESDRFPDRVLTILDEAGLPADMLELEITESIAMADPQRVSDLLAPLKKRGVRLAIDDFGAGHSSLAALTRLPFDVFKIDQQFVRSLEDDPSAPAVIETVLALARALDYETVAEGVETEAQAAFLRRRGCTLGQGYLFSRPLAGADFIELLDIRQPVKARAAGS